MMTSTEIRQRAIELVEKLPEERLVEAVELLEYLFENDRQRGEETPSPRYRQEKG
ncbi:MAG: hypothetical protein AB4352_29995 [Hormoscilla sp.]